MLSSMIRQSISNVIIFSCYGYNTGVGEDLQIVLHLSEFLIYVPSNAWSEVL